MLSVHFYFFLTVLLSSINCTLIVYSPKTLADEIPSGIPFSLANFGHVPYGRTLIAPVKLAEPFNACSPLNPINPDEVKEAPFILIKRGNCTFVTKVKYAQLIGAKMAIIVDDKPDISENVTMIDDGFSYSLRIPSIFIEKKDGDKLYEYLSSNDVKKSDVVLTITFDTDKSDKIELFFWLSTSNRNSFRLVRDFDKYYKLLQHDIKFNPHYAIWPCPDCYATNYSQSLENCISGGRYCCPDPDGNGPATGSQVVQEDLRQLCIYQNYPDLWWNYMKKFDSSCNIELQVVEDCTNNLMKSLNIDTNKIKKCFNESFITSENSEVNVNIDDNKILRNERNLFLQNGIQFWPSVSINNDSFKGNIEGEQIFEAVCSKFNQIPEYCYDVMGVTVNEKMEGISVSKIVILVIITLLIFLLFLVFCYRTYLKRMFHHEMGTKVSEMVSQYIAFYESREKKSNSIDNEGV